MKKRKTKRLLLILTSVLVVAGLAAGGYTYYKISQKHVDQLAVSESTKKQAEQQEVEQAKSDSNKNSQQSGSPQASSNQPTGSAGVTITSVGVSEGNVYASALVNGATSGTCNVKFEKSGATTVQKSADIGLQVSYYICKGFVVPASQFSQKGEWNVTISIDTPNGKATSETKKVNVQ